MVCILGKVIFADAMTNHGSEPESKNLQQDDGGMEPLHCSHSRSVFDDDWPRHGSSAGSMHNDLSNDMTDPA